MGRLNVNLAPHDLVRLFPSLPGQARGVDLCFSLSRMHRVFVDGVQIVHESSKNRGATWTREPAGGIADAANSETTPTICCDPWNRLWIGFHNASGAQVYMSPNLGARWFHGSEGSVGWPTMAGHTFPRVAWAMQGMYVACHYTAAASLRLFHPIQLLPGADLTPVNVAEFAASEQLADLNTDRRNRLVLINQAGGATMARIWRADRWDDPIQIAIDERDRTVFSFALARGIHAFWQGLTLQTQLTQPNMIAVAEQPLVTPPNQAGLSPHYVGISADRYHWYWLIAALDAGGFRLWRSENKGQTWLQV